MIAQSSDGTSVSVPVAFDPNAPIPPPPTVAITPAGPYRNNQIVRIKGHNFAPKAAFSVSECVTQPNEQDCFSTGGGPQVTTANGSLSTQFQVQRRLEAFSGFVDCLTKGVQCTLEISSEGGADVIVPLTFKPKPVATAAVTPATSVATRAVSSWAGLR